MKKMIAVQIFRSIIAVILAFSFYRMIKIANHLFPIMNFNTMLIIFVLYLLFDISLNQKVGEE